MFYLCVVYESAKRHKSKGGVNVFRFAETVEDKDWSDHYDAKNIEVLFYFIFWNYGIILIIVGSNFCPQIR